MGSGQLREKKIYRSPAKENKQALIQTVKRRKHSASAGEPPVADSNGFIR